MNEIDPLLDPEQLFSIVNSMGVPLYGSVGGSVDGSVDGSVVGFEDGSVKDSVDLSVVTAVVVSVCGLVTCMYSIARRESVDTKPFMSI